MISMPNFSLTFIRQESHLLLPQVTSIVLAQNLHDMLFQYVITPEREKKLQEFISLLDNHIKSKSRAPFSVPVDELAFLAEGIEELKLLNWREVPVSVFEVHLKDTTTSSEEETLENIIGLLEHLISFNRKPGTNIIHVFPLNTF